MNRMHLRRIQEQFRQYHLDKWAKPETNAKKISYSWYYLQFSKMSIHFLKIHPGETLIWKCLETDTSH